MSDLLWQKPGVAVDTQIQAFLAGDDVLLDREFFLHDIAASGAHAEGLQRIGILSGDELDGLKRELAALADDFRSGAFVLDERFEDGHSAIEARLTERLGDAGRKIHTGRSRNDQILVATRLWLKEKLARVAELSREIAKVALDRAEAEKNLPIPGYTHIQRAVVSSAGMWWAGWAEAFIDDAIRAADTLKLVDANPLGTAAGYGVNLKLDREHTTQALGFARMQVSPIYAQLSRGKFELAALEALGSATLDLRRLAWDLSPAWPPRAPRSNNCCPCPPATNATCRRRRARSSTASVAGLPRWNCCRPCWPTWNGARTASASPSIRACTRPMSRWKPRSPGCRSAMPTRPPPHPPTARGRAARRKARWPHARHPVPPPTCGWTNCARAGTRWTRPGWAEP